MFRAGRSLPTASRSQLTGELWRGPLEAAGNFQKLQGPLPAVTPGWSFRTLFLPLLTQDLSWQVGFQELFPEGWRQRGAQQSWHPRHRGPSHSHQSSEGPWRLSISTH